ncbi:MAG TPA: helicase-related protein, partial [Candidatus Thermoplasmatota archaeon]|nr:helicase-related protein [Candidatus Thermoplasmatota archaeon]
IGEHGRVLVFHNTRDGAELLASRSDLLDQREGRAQPLLGLHHGSLSAEHRADMEDRFRSGELRGLVATSSLELGIDIGDIDHVVQVQSPRSVARLVQRLGRAGHRAGAVSEGTMLAAGAEDALECMAVAHRARQGRLEPMRVRSEPLVVLANQLVALTSEYDGLDRDWTRRLFQRAGTFRDLDDDTFDAAWDVMLRLRTLYPQAEDPRRIGRSARARKHFLEHVSLIPDERTYRILDESTKRSVGTVDDAFVAAALHPGAVFTMAGRNWTVLEVQVEEQRVRVGPVRDLGAVPQWAGQNLPVSFEVAQEVARLRRAIDEGDEGLLAQVPHGARAMEVARAPLDEQKRQGLLVPTDRLVTLEVGKRVIVANVALGTRGNEALARLTQALLSQRLGSPVTTDSDAYRIHFTMPTHVVATQLADIWRELDPRAVDLLLSLALRDSSSLRHHLVHVAKHFGALPKELDPNHMRRAKLDDLMAENALETEATSRLMWDRLDVEAVAWFLTELREGRVSCVAQAMGPISLLGQEETRRLLAPPKSNETLLAAVRERLESADALLACCNCAHAWPQTVRLIPRHPQCRRCGSNQVACLRPWNEDKVPLLRRDVAGLDEEQRQERERMVRNGQIVASFGQVACLALVARGVGPDTAARILQKVRDPANPNFWREILQAELTFARTSAFWKK